MQPRALVALVCAFVVIQINCSSSSTPGVLFADDFNRTENSLGSQWTTTGTWLTQELAQTKNVERHLGVEKPASCADCEVQAVFVNPGTHEAGLVIRAQAADSSQRYELFLRQDRHIEIRRVSGTDVTVLGEQDSGLASGTPSATLSLQVFATSPAHLHARVNDELVFTADDTSGKPALGAGLAGLVSPENGVSFEHFRLLSLPPSITQVGQEVTNDGGTDDGGTVDAGGTIDAGSPDAGAVDAGSPDAGMPTDGGTVDAGSPLPSTDWSFYRHDLFGQSNVDVPLTTELGKSLTTAWTVQRTGDGSDANPIVVDGVVYIVWNGGRLQARNAATGDLIWDQKTGIGPKTMCAPLWAGPIGAVAVVGGRVIMPGGDGTMYAFDQKTGTLLWSTPIADVSQDNFLWSSSFPLHGKIYVGVATLYEPICGAVPGRVVVLDQATGQVTGTWWVNANMEKGSGIWTQPAYDERTNRLFFTTGTVGDGIDPTTTPNAQAMVAIDPDTLQVVDGFQVVPTPFAKEFDFGASPTLFDLPNGKHLIAATNKDGLVYALDRDHLSQGVVWQYQISGSGASPDLGESSIVSAAYAHGLLFVAGGQTTDNYPGAIAALDPATGQQQWLVHPDGFVLPALTAVGDVLVAAATHLPDKTGRFYLLDQQTGETLSMITTPGQLFAPPSFAEGLFYAADTQGNFFAFKPGP